MGAQPEWFFDDELSRLRWEWAASMRDPDVAADRGHCEELTRETGPASPTRVGYGDGRAVWTATPGDEHADRRRS